MSTHSYGAIGVSDDCDLDDSKEILNFQEEMPKKSYMTAFASTLVAIFVSTLLIFLATSRQNILRKSGEQFELKSTIDGVIGISSVSNEYGIQDHSAMLPYSFLVDSFLIEPYKSTTIVLDATAGCSHQWSFTNKKNSNMKSIDGESSDGIIIVNLSAVGEYSFNVIETCDNVAGGQLSMNVWVKYVRRELQSLTNDDREAFLDAFHTLFSVSTTEGRKLYGDRYKSVKYFSTLHNDAGGNSVCDEYHGGKGFLSNHMFLSSYLEQSLQLVNPAVALHYMEYSKYFESVDFVNCESEARELSFVAELIINTDNFCSSSTCFQTCTIRSRVTAGMRSCRRSTLAHPTPLLAGFSMEDG